jgi:hypothetical protein
VRIRQSSAIVSLVLPIALLTARAGTETARADSTEEVRIEQVEPGWNDSLLVCTVRIRGVPTPPVRETLESGLPSALVFSFTLFRLDGEEIGTTIADISIEPDLWEGIYRMRTPLFDAQAATMDELAEMLRTVGPLPVSRLANLPASFRGERLLRLRARLAIHPLAPAQAERVHALFTGGAEQDDPDRREISVGIGALIRRFLGRESTEDWAAETLSSPFDPRSPAQGKE